MMLFMASLQQTLICLLLCNFSPLTPLALSNYLGRIFTKARIKAIHFFFHKNACPIPLLWAENKEENVSIIACPQLHTLFFLLATPDKRQPKNCKDDQTSRKVNWCGCFSIYIQSKLSWLESEMSPMA